MPYYRVKRYNSKRRFRRSYNKRRQFSRFNTYKNRSSKAQAYQIYSLNKKVNTLMRYTKPETQVKFLSLNSSVDDSYFNNFDNTDKATYSVIFPVAGTDFFKELDGRLCRVRQIKLYATFTAEYTQVFPSFCRLIFVQTKKQQLQPTISQIITYSDGDTAGYEKGPLRTGITSSYKILKQRVIKISSPTVRSKNFRINLSNVGNLRCEGIFKSINIEADPANQIYPSGQVFCIALFGTQGFKSNSQNEYPLLTLANIQYKVAYVDQN